MSPAGCLSFIVRQDKMVGHKRPISVWISIVLLSIVAIPSVFISIAESRQVTFRTFTSIATTLWVVSSLAALLVKPIWGRRLTIAFLIWTLGVFGYGYCRDLINPPRHPVSKHFFLAPTLFTAAWLAWFGLGRASIAYFKQQMKDGEPGATDNPDDAQRLREDH